MCNTIISWTLNIFWNPIFWFQFSHGFFFKLFLFINLKLLFFHLHIFMKISDPRVKYRMFAMRDCHADEQNIMGLKIEG
jgi:hypothetical protein